MSKGWFLSFVALVILPAATPWAQGHKIQKDEARYLDARVTRLSRAGKQAAAISAARRSLAIRERKLGEYHMDVALSVIQLAVLYGGLGR